MVAPELLVPDDLVARRYVATNEISNADRWIPLDLSGPYTEYGLARVAGSVMRS